jgi:uncharacterized protein (TIGR03435 family)
MSIPGIVNVTAASAMAAFVNGGIMSVPVAAAVWLLLRIAPRRALNAATRYAIWCAALAIVITLPALYLPLHRNVPAAHVRAESASETGVEMDAAYDASSGLANGARSGPVRVEKTSFDAAPSRWPRFPIEIQAARWVKWVAIAWIAIAALMLARLCAALVILKHRKAHAFAVPAEIATGLGRWAVICGTKRRIALASSEDLSAPVAAGLRHPSILIPAALFSELDAAQLDQIGLHETAHLARHDDYALIVQRAVEAVFAVHPVVRWIARRIDLEREIACDDFVVNATGRAGPYAECLTRVVELAAGVRGSPIAAAAAEERSQLATRVEMLLDKRRNTGTGLLKARLTVAMIGLTALVGVVAAAPGVVAFTMPRNGTIDVDPQQQPQQPPAAPVAAARASGQPAPVNPSVAAQALAQERSPQSVAPTTLPKFEVASIRPSKSADGRTVLGGDAGRLTANNVTVKKLIENAYGIKDFQISGGPSWAGSDLFDISAKSESSMKPEDLWLMIQALLADRFKLVVRRETKEMPVYALLVAKNGPKFRDAKESDPNIVDLGGRSDLPPGVRPRFMIVRRGRFTGQGIDMETLAWRLTGFLGRTVLDKTGLKAQYDLKFEWVPDENQIAMFQAMGVPEGNGAPPADWQGPSLFTALEEQLGLKLDSQKGPVEMFVIDHVEKPSDNFEPPVAKAEPSPTPQAPPAAQAPLAVDPKSYVIGAGDILKISIWREPDLSGAVGVRPDGKITRPLIGGVQAAGLTPERLAATLKEAYSEKVRNPEIAIEVIQVNSKHGSTVPEAVPAPRALQGNLAAASTSQQAAPVPPATQALPKFEVASIRVNGNPPGRFIVPLPGGKISCTGDSLKDLVGMAWGVSPDEVLSGPAWADSIRYNILAKAEDGATQGMSINQIGQYNRLMMRSLLAERFHVAVHLETREAPIYALVIARKDGKLGPGLKEPKVGQCAQLEIKPFVLPEDGTFPELMCGAGLLIFKGTARGAQSEIKSLTSPLSRVVGRRVVDETGLKQRFDIEMQWSNKLVPSDNQPSIFIALEEQLGLKLESRKGPVDFMVIDHAERPTEN